MEENKTNESLKASAEMKTADDEDAFKTVDGGWHRADLLGVRGSRPMEAKHVEFDDEQDEDFHGRK